MCVPFLKSPPWAEYRFGTAVKAAALYSLRYTATSRLLFHSPNAKNGLSVLKVLSSYVGNYRASRLWSWSSLVTGYKDLSLPTIKWGQQRHFPSSFLCLGQGMHMTPFPCRPYPTYPRAGMPVLHPDSRGLPASPGEMDYPALGMLDQVSESSWCLSCFVEVTK